MEIHLDFTYIPAWLLSVLCVMWVLNSFMSAIIKAMKIRIKKKILAGHEKAQKEVK